ncbi:MAG: hypothetical protein OEM91_17595, partial [Hyphomicrobiales bacterium]|nr:hypothetical protein [Hyphomicrobiales bacterium]
PFNPNVAIAHKTYVVHDTVMERLCRRLNKRTARDHIRLKSVDEIPRNSSGKVDRGPLLALFTEGAVRSD